MGCSACQRAQNRQRAREAASAAACAVCRFSASVDPSECSYGLEGVQVALRVKGQNCPLNRFPDSDGIVRFWKCRWFGVPMPVRLWLALRHPKHPSVESWAGCGCLVRVKAYLARLDPMAHWVTKSGG